MGVRVFAVSAVLVAATALLVVPVASPSGASTTAETTPSAVALCNDLLEPVMSGALPSSEPLAACQWDMPWRPATACGSG